MGCLSDIETKYSSFILEQYKMWEEGQEENLPIDCHINIGRHYLDFWIARDSRGKKDF